MFRFLFSRRWLGLGLFVAFMAIASWFLGNWQLDRWEARKASNERAAVQLEKAPVPLSTIETKNGAISTTNQWTNVELQGSFRSDVDVVVRYIKRDTRPGVEIITPFDTTDGQTVLVHRGWMQTENTGARPDNIPPAPEGEMTISGWWQPDGVGNRGTTIDDDSVRAIDSTKWTERLGTKAVPGYVAMQEPVIDGLIPKDPPELGNGPHFFYAIQWFFFGLLAIFGGFWFVRAELIEQREGQAKVTKSK